MLLLCSGRDALRSTTSRCRTRDMESIWREGYRAVHANLRGPHPRHLWPGNPTTAEPMTGRPI
ncbi:ATP-dependent helicase C-terminal domain-containing protein [Kitasatospora sp. NPDC057512]|uniref:ATP-dependent helicase C-terminal domain-containing protein n=1 Tax=Kitasatospora sp. NPDC057512 TaxID=3346154 RepID=UPI00367390CA